MTYFKYSSFCADNHIHYFWETPPAVSNSTCIDEGHTSSSCKTKYHNLPHSLKSCLDYCAFISFINNSDMGRIVDKEELVRLILAEGLIEEKTGELGDASSLEDIAASLIEQLISLEMLISENVFHCFSGSSTWIKVKEPYYKLCVVEASSDEFAAKNFDSPIRLFVRLYDGNDVSRCLKNLPIRTLFLFFLRLQPSLETLDTISGLRSLLVLYTLSMSLSSGISFSRVRELLNLRFLRAPFPCWSDEVVSSLINLQNLQTLDVTTTFNFKTLPEEVLCLKNLRHVIMKSFYPLCRLGKGIRRLVNLRTLLGLDGRFDAIGDLGSLTEMRCLEVPCVMEETVKELLEAIMAMKQLTFLSMEAEYIDIEDEHEIQVFPFLEPFSPPPLLQELYLKGNLMEWPSWFASMNNLTALILMDSSLKENPSATLQCLPKLKHLCLANAYDTKVMDKDFCRVGGFPKLEILVIKSAVLVEWREIVDGAFPFLKELECEGPRLKFIPLSIRNICSLEKIKIGGHEDLIRRLNGDENHKIKQIPSVNIHSVIWGVK